MRRSGSFAGPNRLCGVAQKAALFVPINGQRRKPLDALNGEFNWLTAFCDGLDNVRCKEGEREIAAYVGSAHAFVFRDFFERSFLPSL